jgi:hypothetical protein
MNAPIHSTLCVRPACLPHGTPMPFFGTIRLGIAFWIAETGDAAAARARYDALLHDRHRASGRDDPGCALAIRYDLGRLIWQSSSGTGRPGSGGRGRDQPAAGRPAGDPTVVGRCPRLDRLGSGAYTSVALARAGAAATGTSPTMLPPDGEVHARPGRTQRLRGTAGPPAGRSGCHRGSRHHPPGTRSGAQIRARRAVRRARHSRRTVLAVTDCY